MEGKGQKPVEGRPVQWWREPMWVFTLVAIVTWASVSSIQSSVERRAGEPPLIGAPTPEEVAGQRLSETLGRTPTEQEKSEAVAWERDRRRLLRRALDYGLHLDDPEIERRLLEKLTVRFAGATPSPSDDELRAWYQNHAGVGTERELAFTQLFFRQNVPRGEAEVIQQQLTAGASPDSFDVRVGYVQQARESSLSRRIDPVIAEEVRKSPIGDWTLVQSGDSWTLLRVEERTELEALPFERVKQRVRSEYVRKQKIEALREWIRTEKFSE